jgi:hypothetical protein
LCSRKTLSLVVSLLSLLVCYTTILLLVSLHHSGGIPLKSYIWQFRNGSSGSRLTWSRYCKLSDVGCAPLPYVQLYSHIKLVQVSVPSVTNTQPYNYKVVVMCHRCRYCISPYAVHLPDPELQWVKKLSQCLAILKRLTWHKSDKLHNNLKIIYVILGHLSFHISLNARDLK